jgi:nucleotide sugar dehydrogenase
VLGVDNEAAVVARLSQGVAGLDEDDLAAALQSTLASRTVRFAATIPTSDVRTAFVIAVPTPVDESQHLQSSAIEAAMKSVQAAAADGDLVVIRSTVPIGFTRRLASRAAALGRRLAFACCPDRSIVGHSFADQFEVPSLVAGLDDQAARDAAALFGLLGQVQVLSSLEAAEALKLFSNVQRDTLFALSNLMAQIAGAAGLDFNELREAGSLKYGRFALPRPGPVGGPCLTKDVFLLAEFADSVGVDISLLRAARKVNHDLVDILAERIRTEIDRIGKPAVVAVLGMAFKGAPPVRDERGSFGRELVSSLKRKCPEIDVRTWDPVIQPGGELHDAAVRNADIVVLANDHPALADLRPLAGARRGARVFDMCGLIKDATSIQNEAVLVPFGSGTARSL